MTENEYTPEMAGSGQRGICVRCKKGPTQEGHDGCLGVLPGPIMNACCGHGNDKQAYIQYWDRARISGKPAIDEQMRLKMMNQATKRIGGLNWFDSGVESDHQWSHVKNGCVLTVQRSGDDTWVAQYSAPSAGEKFLGRFVGQRDDALKHFSQKI